MSDTTAQPEGLRTPPKWIFRFVNPIMGLLLRSPFHGWVSDRLLLLGFTGRKSGKQYRLPVGYHWEDGELLSFSIAKWPINLERGAPVTLWLKGKKRRGTAEAISDAGAIASSLHRYGQEEGFDSLRMRAPTISFSGDVPERAELEKSAEKLTMIRTRLID